MKHLPTNERTEAVAFEGLEARLLLAAAPLIQPDGPMPQAAGPGCGPPVEEATQAAADADGDGKLGLNDVKTSAAPEPTSLSFNGRGIDLNEDAKVDLLGSVEPDGIVIRMLGVHNDTSSAEADGIVIRMLGVDNDTDTDEADGLGGGISLVNGDFSYEARFARDGKITPWERMQLSSSEEMPVRAANPETAFGSGGPLGAVMGGVSSVLGGGGGIGKMLGPFSSGDVVPASGMPITYVLLDFPWPDEKAADSDPVQQPPATDESYGYCMCPRNLFAEVSGAGAAAGVEVEVEGLYRPESKDIDTIIAYEPVWAVGTAPWIGGSILAVDGTLSLMIGVNNGTPDGAAPQVKIMALRVANPEGAGTGGPLGALMGGVG